MKLHPFIMSFCILLCVLFSNSFLDNSIRILWSIFYIFPFAFCNILFLFPLLEYTPNHNHNYIIVGIRLLSFLYMPLYNLFSMYRVQAYYFLHPYFLRFFQSLCCFCLYFCTTIIISYIIH